VYENKDDDLEPQEDSSDVDMKDALKYSYDFKAANPD